MTDSGRLSRWQLPILVGVLLAVYAPGLFLTFGFYDDYYALNWAVHGSAKLLAFCAAQGRPIDGILSYCAFELPGSVKHLAWLRGATLVGLAAFAWTIRSSLIRAGWPAGHALCASIVLATLPAAQVFAIWSIEIAKPWAGVLAGIAAILACRAIDQRRSAPGWILVVFAVMTLFAAFMIYQPGAMIFFVFVAIDLFPPGRLVPRWPARFARLCIIAGVALGADWVLFRVSSHTIDIRQFPGMSIVDRARMIPLSALPRKLWFFITTPLNESLRGPALLLSGTSSFVIALFVVIGLLLYFRGGAMDRLSCLLAAMALAPATFVCNLFSLDPVAAYRMQVALEFLVAIYGMFAIQGWWRGIARLFVSLRTKSSDAHPPGIFVPIVVPVLIALLSCILANYYFMTYLAVPQSVEWSSITAMVRSLDKNTDYVKVIRIATAEPVLAPAHLREFGLPTSTRDFAAADLVSLAIREARPELRDLPVDLVSDAAADALTPPPRTAVIDLRQLRKMELATRP